MLVPSASITVQETSIFSRRADALLSVEERAQLIDFLANNPLAGDVIEGTGGVRKVRFAAKGRGKSGGVRVIYYFY
ncbi:MAG: addiction module toxin RelE, partial [Alphaproteobacteria bacterium]|nr:addiction module toxin RelE [Alphaproteobacteria bacterium]